MASVTLRSGVASTSNSGAVASASFTPTAGDLLVVFAFHSGKTTAPTVTASANGITFTQAGTTILKNSSADSMTCWVSR